MDKYWGKSSVESMGNRHEYIDPNLPHAEWVKQFNEMCARHDLENEPVIAAAKINQNQEYIAAFAAWEADQATPAQVATLQRRPSQDGTSNLSLPLQGFSLSL
jgi:hypothetical protein